MSLIIWAASHEGLLLASDHQDPPQIFRCGQILLAVAGDPAYAAQLAAYLEKQVSKPGSAKNKASIALGQKIYRAGIAEKAVPACASCHGPAGAGIPIQYPRIGGQWADYTVSQLSNFRSGERKNSPQMHDIAIKLTDAEIKAVSDYIAGIR